MFQFIRLLGSDISVEYQTIGLRFRNMDKMRISYKMEGGGFQVDSLCGRGYTYAFLLKNEAVQK